MTPPTRQQGVTPPTRRQATGQRAERTGRKAEQAAEDALHRDGWTVLARRLRTEAGEIDLLAEKEGLLAVIEVKARGSLADAAAALQPRQRRRIVAAAGIVLAEHPEWGRAGVRFDVLLVDGAGQVRRIAGAFRADD